MKNRHYRRSCRGATAAARARRVSEAADITLVPRVAIPPLRRYQGPMNRIADHQVILGDGRRLPADQVMFSVGVQPELTLAKKAGLSSGPS